MKALPTTLLLAAALLAPCLAWSEPPALPGEIPARLEAATSTFDHQRREVMVPMRDGVRLHTVILVPRGAKRAPLLLTRTPYDADALTRHRPSSHLGPVLQGYDNATEVVVGGGYIRVVQDVRGKHGSEGEYVMNRPLRGPQNPTAVDHATDTWDTIDWLVKNVPESNGRVGVIGISYDGFLALTALVDPHPALKVAVPMNPMVDGWLGDDWFHHGAFRQQQLPYIYEQEATTKSEAKWWSGHLDDYDEYLQAGSAGELARRHGMEQLGFWRKVEAHPAYDAFWRDQAMDTVLAARPLTVPTLLVHSLWDAEDIHGALAVYRALLPQDPRHEKLFLAIGPWSHGQGIVEGSSLGALRFGADTARFFRREVLRPFLDRYLQDGAPQGEVAPVTAFETGTDVWRRLPTWPAGCASGCAITPTPLYLRAGLGASFEPPRAGDAPFEAWVSDPAKPVPYRARPVQPVGYDNGLTWPRWLVDDQREASGRTDVVAFVSEPLTKALKLAGQPVANLVASTTGTDADWVVKVIDVYPDEVAEDAQLGGYQLMVSADIFRGRYRESLETPKAVKAGEALAYRFPLPAVHHVFLPGHRVMVQVQSSWFPLYDRNPQTFVPSIFNARPGDYRAATQRVHHAPGKASFIELPVVGPAAAPPGAVGPGSPAEAAMFAKNAEYEHFMGRWSRLLSPKHLAFAGVKDGDRVLDVGAGTGALASQVAAAMPSSEVVGIDPSPAFVEYAQRKAASKREHFEVGDAQALRFKTGEFDATLAQLVMNFIPDHQKAVREMRRVTRPGGVISACVWGYDDGTDMLRYFWDEVVADDPRMAARGERTIKLARKGELAAVWRGAGLLDVKEAAVGVPLSFSSFEDYWQPFLDGVGPAGAWVASLDEPGRKKVETRLRKSLLGERADGPIVLQARAWCVRGQVPAGP